MIPKHFNLLGYNWAVVTSNGPLFATEEPKEVLHGYCDFTTHTIYLSGDLKGLDLWHTFLHELLHAALEAIGRPKLGADEGLVDSLSGALAQALNPGLKTVRAPRRAVRKAPSKRSR